MSVLLASTPYITAVALYWVSCGDLFGRTHAEPPHRWLAQLCLSVLTAALTPLPVAAASAGHTHDDWLLGATVLGLLFTTTTLALARGPQSFYDLQLPLRAGKCNVPRWQLARAIGVLVIVYAGAATVAVIR